MAEKVRFELTVLAYTRVPGVHLKPLGHLSAITSGTENTSAKPTRGANIAADEEKKQRNLSAQKTLMQPRPTAPK